MALRLTQDQIDQYHRDGHLSPIRVMPPAEAARLKAETEAFEAAQGKVVNGSQTSKCCLLMPWVYDMVRRPEILDVVEDLIGPDILMYQNGAWFKEPESNSYVSWHQDLNYYGMDSMDLVTCWVALTPANRESGCLQVMPGSHKGGMVGVDYTQVTPDNMLASGQQSRYPVDDDKLVAMELQPGEMSLHHSCAVHASYPNRGSVRRMGFSIAFMPPSVGQTTRLRATAMLMRGRDDYGHYELEQEPPVSPQDAATVARHEAAVTSYRNKAKECGNQTAWRLGDGDREAGGQAS